MASIVPYTTQQGRRWMVRYRKPDGASTDKGGFATKKAAQAWLEDNEHSKRVGKYVDPTRGKITVEDLATAWLKTKPKLGDGTRARYENIIEAHIIPYWGDKPVSTVRFVDVQSWITEQPQAAATIAKHHRVFSQILDLAVRDDRIFTNPAKGVELPQVRHKKRRYLTGQQVEDLANASKEWAPLILFLAYTGLRWSEMASLHVKDLNLTTRRAYITEGVTVVRGKQVRGDTKNHQHRWVPIPQSVCDELAVWVAGRDSGDVLFAGTRKGGPLRNQVARRMWFDQAVIDAKCPEGFTPHELRHTAASLAISSGASVKAVQRMLGHAKASMTLDVYADLFDDDLDAVGNAMESARMRVKRVGEDASVGEMWVPARVVGEEPQVL